MGTETSYRMAVVGLIALGVPIGVYHRWKAHTGERLVRRDEGLLIMIGIRLSGLGCLVGILAYLADPRNMSWAQVELPSSLRWAGFPLGLLAIAWGTWMFRSLGSNLTDTVTVRARATLVTDGPYRWVRHPLYLTAILMLGSLSLLTASVYLAAFGTLTILLLIVRTGTEEAQLEARFGESYRAYRSRTGFLFPRLRSLG